MKRLFAAILTGCLLLIAACSDDPTTPEISSTLRGYVLDSDGTPVAGAGVIMNYKLPLTETPHIRIGIHLNYEDHVQMYVTSECSEERVITLLDEVLPAGTHWVAWDTRDEEGKLVPSGLYQTNAAQHGFIGVGNVMIFRDDIAPETGPTDYSVQATTNSEGYFTLEQECLPFDRHQYLYDDQGNVVAIQRVSREVRFFALHDNHEATGSDWVLADEAAGCQVTIQF